jgi:hypothetical protein
MSVTGSTSWRLNRSIEQFQSAKDSEREKDLMFGLYDFEFIEELREKSGASFFT